MFGRDHLWNRWDQRVSSARVLNYKFKLCNVRLLSFSISSWMSVSSLWFLRIDSFYLKWWLYVSRMVLSILLFSFDIYLQSLSIAIPPYFIPGMDNSSLFFFFFCQLDLKYIIFIDLFEELTFLFFIIFFPVIFLLIISLIFILILL